MAATLLVMAPVIVLFFLACVWLVRRLRSRQGPMSGGFGDARSGASATGPAINKPVLSIMGPRGDPTAHLLGRDRRKGEFKAAAMA